MIEHVQTCLRIVWIVTIHIILILNKFRPVWTSSDMFVSIHIILILNMFRHVSESESWELRVESWELRARWLHLGKYFTLVIPSIKMCQIAILIFLFAKLRLVIWHIFWSLYLLEFIQGIALSKFVTFHVPFTQF